MKKRFRRLLKNKFALATLCFIAWISFFSNIDIFYIAKSYREWLDMKQELAQTNQKKTEAEKNLKDLVTNDATLERFAREEYYMKRDNEVVFVFKERTE